MLFVARKERIMTHGPTVLARGARQRCVVAAGIIGARQIALELRPAAEALQAARSAGLAPPMKRVDCRRTKWNDLLWLLFLIHTNCVHGRNVTLRPVADSRGESGFQPTSLGTSMSAR